MPYHCRSFSAKRALEQAVLVPVESHSQSNRLVSTPHEHSLLHLECLIVTDDTRRRLRHAGYRIRHDHHPKAQIQIDIQNSSVLPQRQLSTYHDSPCLISASIHAIACTILPLKGALGTSKRRHPQSAVSVITDPTVAFPHRLRSRTTRTYTHDVHV